jgi:acyl carrier protein
MSEQTVEQKLTNIIVEVVGINADAIKPESKFIDDLGLDSLDVVELVMEVEEAFGIEITDEEADNTPTFAEAVTLIKSRAK